MDGLVISWTLDQAGASSVTGRPAFLSSWILRIVFQDCDFFHFLGSAAGAFLTGEARIIPDGLFLLLPAPLLHLFALKGWCSLWLVPTSIWKLMKVF
jgi:hypothetical protein